MQLDAWNWKTLYTKRCRAFISVALGFSIRYSAERCTKEGMKQIEEVRQFFRDAKSIFSGIKT